MRIFADNRIEIRTISELDLSQVLKIYVTCEDFLSLGPRSKATMSMVIEDIAHSERENGVYCGVFDLKGDMIGIVDYVPNSFMGNVDTGFISLVMIAKPYRSKGIGTMVVKAVEDNMRSDPRTKVVLSAVQTNNTKAINFWTRIGYQIVSDPESRPDDTVVFNLRKDLQKY